MESSLSDIITTEVQATINKNVYLWFYQQDASSQGYDGNVLWGDSHVFRVYLADEGPPNLHDA